jgi:hypothetical protein
MMKKCSTPTIFVNRVTHISVYNKKIEGQFYPECFADTKNVYYNDYKVKSESRKIEFLITKEYFDKKIKQQCYLCGKFPTITHKNGLDRVDSLIGYIESNLQTCCSNCNYMKSNYSLELFLHKCESISKYYLSKYRDIEPIQEIRQIVKGNKLTPEEKKEKDKCRKQAQRDALRKKYGDEEYKKLHAKKIAEQRKKKNVEN